MRSVRKSVEPEDFRLREIATVVEGVINESGEGGLERLCFFGISKPFAQHIYDPAFVSEYELWIKVIGDVCLKRRIPFDAKATCEKYTDHLWAHELGITLE